MPQHGYKYRHGAFFYNSERRNKRKTSALQRNTHWESLSLEEQLADLDLRLGKGLGAKKQRAKIEKLISEGLTHCPKKKEKVIFKPKPKEGKYGRSKERNELRRHGREDDR